MSKSIINKLAEYHQYLKQKKGMAAPLELAVGAVLAFLILIVFTSLGPRVTDDLNNGLTGDALAAVDNGTRGFTNLASYWPLVGTVMAIVIIVGLLVVGFYYFRPRGS